MVTFSFGMDVFQDQVKGDKIAQDRECQIDQEDQDREHLEVDSAFVWGMVDNVF